MATCVPGLAQDASEDSADDPESDAEAGYRYLLREASISVNSKGLKTTRMHNRIEIQKQHAVDVIGDISIPYNAFRSEARVVKAFTVAADGHTVQLKKEAVRDLVPDEVSSCQMYTDVHQLTFSMPAVGKGAVIDYEVEIEEKKPVIPGEFWISEYLDFGVEVSTSRVTVAFPSKREVRLVTTNLTAQALVEDATNGGTRTLTWEMKNNRALRYEPGMPPFSAVRAQVHLTSVKSWQQVEEWYAGLAKKHLQADDEVRNQARQLVNGLTNQLEQIQALYRYASHDVRYVGVELGRSAYEPHPPRETMQNKYGDCKDKAALLVSLLNAIGVRAHMAIVRPNSDGPVDQYLPGPAQFNHAIVYVPREQGDLWIDATQPFGDVKEHGYHLDGIDAMVVGLPGKVLVPIPVSDETHSIHRVIFDLDVHYGGLCTVHEVQEFMGRAAVSERDRRTRLDSEKVRKQLEHNFNSQNGYARLLSYSFTNPTNDCVPMRVTTDYESDSFLTATKSGLTVRFDGADLRSWLDVPRPDPATVRKQKRIHPWVSRIPHTEEIICRLHLAQGYELARVPQETRKELPQGKAELLFDKSAGTPCLTLRVVRRPAVLQPNALPEIAQQVDQAVSRIRASLDIEESLNGLITEHRFAKAEAALLEAGRRATNSTDAQIRLGSFYSTVGRVYQSRLLFEKAIALSPQDPRGYQMLAETYSGWWGLPGPGFDRKAIMAVFDLCQTNVPALAWALRRKAGACLIDDLGRGDSTNHLEEAERYFRESLKEDAHSYKGLLGLGSVYRLRGNYDEAETYYRKAEQVNPGEVEPRAGIWISLAYAGHAEEAWNAMAAYYGPGQQMNTEVIRVASLLTASRRYEAAASLYDRLVESAGRPEVIQRLARMLRKADKVKQDNYEKFFDDSSPESLAQTLMIASLMDDTNRVFRCLSPAVNRDAVRRSMQLQSQFMDNFTAKINTNYFADIVLSFFETSKRTLDSGDVEVKLDGTKSTGALSSLPTVATFQVRAVSNHWQAITINEVNVDCATLSRLALAALERNDLAGALAWQRRLADLTSRPAPGRSAPALAEHLQEIAFTNDVLRVKAWAGVGLAASSDRAELARAVECLEDVLVAYADDPQLKVTVAHAHYQLANLRKAAAILSSIDVSKLTAPDQLGELGRMLIELERVDSAEKIIARLREVAPDDERSLWLQADALTYRGKYGEAARTMAKLHDRAKLDSRIYLPYESRAIALSGDQGAMRELVERWREPEKPIAAYRPAISYCCLTLDLFDEASEQIATMLAEGAVNADALVGYAGVALFRGDTAEARHLVSVADRLAQRGAVAERMHSFALVHLGLGDFAEAARLYRVSGKELATHSSGHSLCMSALASKVAGDAPAASESLKLAATMQGDSDWPRLAVQYIRGEISEDEFRRAPERTTATPYLRASRECEVNCMVALHRESKRDFAGAIAAYQACIATKSTGDTEYSIAKLALLRLRKEHADITGQP